MVQAAPGYESPSQWRSSPVARPAHLSHAHPDSQKGHISPKTSRKPGISSLTHIQTRGRGRSRLTEELAQVRHILTYARAYPYSPKTSRKRGISRLRLKTRAYPDSPKTSRERASGSKLQVPGRLYAARSSSPKLQSRRVAWFGGGQVRICCMYIQTENHCRGAAWQRHVSTQTDERASED